MADKYANWQELVTATNPDGTLVNVEGRDWSITVRPGSGDYLTHLAIHGGAIEPPPQQLADYASGGGPFYTFAGLKSSGNVDLHITSTHFDEPRALAQATGAERIVSWHGHADRVDGHAVTYVGGLDAELGALIRARLEAAGFLCEEPPEDLGGSDPLNICNRGRSGGGVQLEMSRSQRAAFFVDGNLARSAIENPDNRTEAFYRFTAAVNAGIADLSPDPDPPGSVLFDLRSGATPLLAPFPLTYNRVIQQVAYEPTTQLMYATQVIANGVTLPGESGPPATGVRDSRGDMAINRVDMAGVVTGVMYCRRFDHGSGIGVEYDPVSATTYVWVAFDAVEQPIGTNGHGRRICRISFQNGIVVDPENVTALQAYVPFTGINTITPSLDLAHRRITVAYNTSAAGTRYATFTLADFKARNFSAPLYTFPRPSYPDFQSWMAYGDYLYQQHGTAYDDATNPPPPDGNGNAFWVVIDMRTGNVVDRVDNTYGLTLDQREPEALAVFDLPSGPQFTFGFAVDQPRQVALYGITNLVDTSTPIRAELVSAPEDGVQLTVSVENPETVQSWEIVRDVDGARQVLFSGVGEGSLPAVSTWFDSAPVGCISTRYYLEISRSDGTQSSDASNAVTYIPEGGCNQGGPAVGGESNTLGCASGYSAQVHWRGGAQPYANATMDRLTEVTWNRTINDVAEASVTVLKGDISSACCEAMKEVHPWVHELTLYRDGELVWQGPITKTTSRKGSIVIQAMDVTAWFDHLVNTFVVQYTKTTADAQGRKAMPITAIAYNHIRLNMTVSSLGVPDYAGIMDYFVVRNTGLPATKVEKDGSKNTSVWTAYLGDILREWAKRGLTWTTVGRSVLLRGKPTSLTRAQARLTMEDFTGDIEVIKDGTQGGTYGFATTQDQQDISDGKSLGYGRTKTAYGRLDVLVSIDEEKVTDADLRQAAKDAIAGRYPIPVSVSVPDGSALAATAPVLLRQLVPGERFDVLAESFCAPVLQGFILTDVEGSWQNGQEKIGITLTPLADIDEELTT